MWIEIVGPGSGSVGPVVTPFAGVWIEIPVNTDSKLFATVTPFAGVWIEIDDNFDIQYLICSHSLRGSVD